MHSQGSPVSSYKNMRYRVSADILCLRLARTGFNYKIQWKRRQNKAQTRVIHHGQPQSLINERLTLDFNMQLDTRTGKYLQKHIDFLPTVVTESGLRSAGVGRIDLAQALNSNATRVEKIVPLAQCPDPNASIQVTLQYQSLGEVNQIDESFIMNTTAAEQAKLSSQKKFQTYSPSRPPLSPGRTENPLQQPPQLQNVAIPNSEAQLRKQIQDLQERLQGYQTRERQLVAENARQVQEVQSLQNLARTKDLELKSKDKEVQLLTSTLKHYSQCKSELLQKEQTIRNLSLKLSQRTSEARKPDPRLPMKEPMQETLDSLADKLEEAERQNSQLQAQLSESNIRLAKMFNAAIQAGGAELLDTLQQAIGME